MEEIAEKGEARRLGISSIHDLQMLRDLYKTAMIKSSVVRNRFYRESAYGKAIRGFCKKKRYRLSNLLDAYGKTLIFSEAQSLVSLAKSMIKMFSSSSLPTFIRSASPL